MSISAVTKRTVGRIPLAFELHNPRKGIHLLTESPIIFLHGFLGSKRENRPDLRNHGDSGHHPKHDYMEMALDIKYFIEKRQLGQATIIGHSMGAKAALSLALHSPHLVKDVVAVDNCPIELPLTPDFLKYVEAMESVNEAQVRTHKEADEILKDIEPSPTIRLWLLSNFVKDNDLPFLKCRVPLDTLQMSIGPLGDFPYKNESISFPRPVLFLRALQSPFIPDTAFPLIRSFFPCSKVVDIDCGHWVVQEKPAIFREGMLQYWETRL
ncbi:Alpha/Beta hydrolase protein [Penicillium taxi]|uniref:Alpha/Beta hydrolase protein n=1 Tax=Penicillium taxi TaxID=168475 RepID=UPI002545A102|nr:Alpha/Beta hydrolase protein [Penicillium taxi]KAJ5895216.1 Alpha/Beta hydrolase protein [Penicillium taxi]